MTQLITSTILKIVINIVFWFFTVGLITAILILKVRLDDIDPRKKQLLISSLYGLTISSFIPKIIFVLVISILYFSNFAFSGKESLIVIPLIGLFSGFLPFFVIVYAIFRSAYHFKIHHIKVYFKHLPKSFNGLKIIQISDLHLGSFNYRYHLLDKAVKQINQEKADYICFTGDLVNNFAWELRGWEKILGNLIAKKGKYAILGNHDYGDYSNWDTEKEKEDNFEAIKQFYEKINFNLLLNEANIIENNNEKIAIIGIENWGKPPFKQYGDLNKAIKQVEKIPFKILLSHDPTHWTEEVINTTNIALTLSGHTHGMQAGFQYKKWEWSPIKYKYKEWAGLYTIKDQYLYVNRGLGWLGFPGRLGMRPEITVIELKRKV
ncbi:metallophosphoesterase [Olleya namhaensis]|uniref:metallophosphoesterase n=1 Tax=Olleya namhaensis TaxID=1144750 RepID=UPI00233003F3|nr:metallophosphoesterase [Olleya namhaensis]